MSDARQHILNNIRTALHRSALSAAETVQLTQRLAEHPRGIIPQRDVLNHADLLELFVREAEKSAASVERLESFNSIPQSIVQLLRQENLGDALRVATDAIVSQINWQDAPNLIVNYGAADNEDKATLTSCLCGIAETGTLVLLSSPTSPTLLNFLPEVHIVLLSTQHIVAAYEDAWDLVRQQDALPRTVNFITGPSRTADIEQKMLMGIHGPKKLHIILYEKGNAL